LGKPSVSVLGYAKKPLEEKKKVVNRYAHGGAERKTRAYGCMEEERLKMKIYVDSVKCIKKAIVGADRKREHPQGGLRPELKGTKNFIFGSQEKKVASVAQKKIKNN